MNSTQSHRVPAHSSSMTTEPLLDLQPETGLGHLRNAARDILEGLGLLRLALTLGWLDIRLRYRGSLLGPFWLTISTAVMVGSMGVLYATLFHINVRTYLPFLSFSLVLWGWLNMVITDGCEAFSGVAGMIHAVRMPYMVHALRLAIRSFLIFMHSLPVIIVVFLLLGVMPHFTWGECFGWLLLLTDTVAFSLLFGVLGARIRDMAPIAASIMQILFFVTPIIWRPELIYLGRQYMLLDPFYPLIEIVRAPLMGDVVRDTVWLMAVFYSGLLWIISFLLFARMRSRLAYWV